MGISNFIKLIKIVDPTLIQNINITDLQNKTIVFDASLFIHKSLLGIRKSMGKEIENIVEGEKISVTHVKIINNRLKKIKENNIKAIFVFDNINYFSELKNNTLDKRKKIKEKMKNKYNNTSDEVLKKKYYTSVKEITEEEYNDIVNLIKLYGFKIIIAKEEADSQCAYMSKNKLVDYIVSDDSDLLLFGSKNIIKNFTVSKNKNMNILYLNKILKKFNYGLSQLIELGILLGCDYTNTVKGIGMNRAFNYITKYKNIKTLKKNNIVPKNYKYEDALDYFKKSPHLKLNKNQYKMKRVNYKNIKIFLLKFGIK